MVATRTLCTLLLASCCMLNSCASAPEETLPADPDLYAQGLIEFESAWEELHEAISATPLWNTDRRSKTRVLGLAELTMHRAEKLRPFVAQGLISDAAIVLMKDEASLRAMIASDALPKSGGTFLEPGRNQLEANGAERAYYRIWRRIDTLEAFVEAGLTTPWIDRTVLEKVINDLKVVTTTSSPLTASWRRVSMTPDGFDEDRERAGRLLDALTRNLQAGDL